MCDLLKSKQDEMGVSYVVEMDRDKILSQGITHVPMLEVGDGDLLNFAEALRFIEAGGNTNVCN